MAGLKRWAIQNALDRWAEGGSDENPAIGNPEKAGADVARYLLAGGDPTREDIENFVAFLMYVRQYAPALEQEVML